MTSFQTAILFGAGLSAFVGYTTTSGIPRIFSESKSRQVIFTVIAGMVIGAICGPLSSLIPAMLAGEAGGLGAGVIFGSKFFNNVWGHLLESKMNAIYFFGASILAAISASLLQVIRQWLLGKDESF